MPKIKNWSKVGTKRKKTYWNHDEVKNLEVSIMPFSWGSSPEDKKWGFFVHYTTGTVHREPAETKEEAREKAVKWMKKHPQGSLDEYLTEEPDFLFWYDNIRRMDRGYIGDKAWHVYSVTGKKELPGRLKQLMGNPPRWFGNTGVYVAGNPSKVFEDVIKKRLREDGYRIKDIDRGRDRPEFEAYSGREVLP